METPRVQLPNRTLQAPTCLRVPGMDDAPPSHPGALEWAPRDCSRQRCMHPLGRGRGSQLRRLRVIHDRTLITTREGLWDAPLCPRAAKGLIFLTGSRGSGVALKAAWFMRWLALPLPV